MSYRTDYKYHVMNTMNSKLTYSSNDRQDAEAKAREYCANSGHSFVVLESIKTFRVQRTVEVVEE
jgi:hypothetical protein